MFTRDLLILLFSNIVTAMTCTLPVTLFTKMAYSKGLSELFVGMIFACYPLSNICFIPFSNNLINYFGRINLLVLVILGKVSFLIYIYQL